MERDGEHARVVRKRCLGSVPVMDVPVDGCHPQRRIARLGVLDGDARVGEDAEPHAVLRTSMVPRRTDECVGVLDCAVEHRVQRGDRSSSRKCGYFEALMAKRRRAVAGVAAFRLSTLHLDPREVLGCVNPQNVDLCRRLRDNPDQVLRQARDLYE